ncbi:MAG: response regulator [Actinomycetota bacterium]|nr:response regulator [Actinomycetota bacterium]
MLANYKDARILIIDDQQSNVAFLEGLLKRAGYVHFLGLTDPRNALTAFESLRPDLILLDLQMPGMDGFAVMEELQPWISNVNGNYLPVLVLTADATKEAKQRSLAAGANDFLAKPLDATEVLLRINNLLETRSLHLTMKNQNKMLESAVRERTADLWASVGQLETAEKKLRLSQEETIERLATAAEFRDDETARHIRRMSHYCELLVTKIGEGEQRAELIRLASQMHDVGKIGIPDNILLKPRPLTPEERSVMQKHCEIGYRILAGSKSQLLQIAATIALTHHERLDGTGYPRKLSDEDIPLEGRIASISDVFDALTTDRVYRKAMAVPDAVEFMTENRGTQFDADLLDVFLASLPEILEIKQQHDEAARPPQISSLPLDSNDSVRDLEAS